MLTTASRISRRKEIGSCIWFLSGASVRWTPPTGQFLYLPTRGVSKPNRRLPDRVVRQLSAPRSPDEARIGINGSVHLPLNADAKERWAPFYRERRTGVGDGITRMLTARQVAQAARLAVIYAVLDASPSITTVDGRTPTRSDFAVTRREGDMEIAQPSPRKEGRNHSAPGGEYNRASVDAARDAGYDAACTTRTGLVSPVFGRFRIPRFMVLDWDADTFSAALQRWFTGGRAPQSY